MNESTALMPAPARKRGGRAKRSSGRRAGAGAAGGLKDGSAAHPVGASAPNRSTSPGACVATSDASDLPAALEASIRRQFFCCAQVAARFRVSVDEVVDHLRCAGVALAPRPQRVLSHLEDVIVAAACVRGDAAAWNHLLNGHAWCLDRACVDQLGASAGLAFARRFWSDLREATMRGEAGPRDPSRPRTRLQSYLGVRPLRLWLADRLLGGATVCAGTAPASHGVRDLDSASRSRTLPLPSGQLGDSAT